MIPGLNEPIPFWDALVDKAGMITDLWTKYFEQTQQPQIRSSTMKLGSYSNGDTPLNASLTSTILDETVPTTGLYIFLLAIQVVAAAAVSSSLTLTLTWTSNGVTQTETFGPITNGTNVSHLSAAYCILADGGTPVSIATTYASNPANDMDYNVRASININGLPGDSA